MSTRFIIGRHPELGEVWVAIDSNTLCSNPTIAPLRFAAYLAPFRNEKAAKAALIDAGASHLEPNCGR